MTKNRSCRRSYSLPRCTCDIYLQRLSDGLIIRVTHNKWEDGTVFWLPAASAVSEVALNAFLFLYLMWSNYWLT